jgi:hypothetical protein
MRLFAFGLFVVIAGLFVVSTWFEGAIVEGIARALYLIPETLGWLIGAL